MEEKDMTNNINTDNITKEQVFNQIAQLQKNLEPLDMILFKVQCVSDSQSYAEQEEGAPMLLDYMPDVALEKINVIREITISRERTINTMLDFYLSVYKKLDDAEHI